MSGKTKVLIVDDEEIVRLSYFRSLTGAHCTVDVALNGEEALNTLSERPFDLVLLDLRMPGIGGMEVLRTIKQSWPDTAVVVVTGFPNLETAKEAVRLGACAYLTKPVGPDDIINAANDAVIQKKWTLHKERADPEVRAGSNTETWGKTGCDAR